MRHDAKSRSKTVPVKLVAAIAATMIMISPAVAQKAPFKLRVGNLKFSASVDLWLAQRKGMFAANGLDVTLTDFRNGQECVSALQANSVDICLLIPGIAMQANERGFNLVVVAQNETAKSAAPDSGSIAVLKDSPIHSLSELVGKKISTSGLHGQQTVAAQVVLKRAGVDLSKIQLIESPTPTQPDLLKSKQVDAVITVDPYTTILQTSGIGRVLSWHFVESVSEQPIGAWYAKAAFVKANADAAASYAKTIREAVDYVNADEPRTRADIAEYTGLSLDLLKSMPLNKWDYRIRLDRWQGVADMLFEMGELQSRHKAQEYMSDSIKPYIINP
jgi:NitT/TauT family transport system substrate-binding protein